MDEDTGTPFTVAGVDGRSQGGGNRRRIGQTEIMTKATDSPLVYLEGGPADLPERIVPISRPGGDVKIPHLNGYEHFRATARETDSADGPLTVYEWFERTEAVS